ncbi:MAG: protein kinase [Myxococcales bacterium]
MLAQLGPYLIDEELAEGGMARVFRARLRGLGGFEKQLVIKQIKPELARDPRFVELFVREANTLVALSHPHIVQVYELGAAEGTYYLSMEYVEGATIASLLEEGPLSPALTAHLGAQICEALDYAHSRFGILHRDITPRNIIVDQAGHARLLDFGIATSVSEVSGELFGSPGYMSPEQARGEGLGPESDFFSLGAVLFECLTGTPAFAKTLRASLTQAPDFARLAGTPPALAQLTQAMLSEAPAGRPKAAAVARALREFLAQTRPEGVLQEMQARTSRASLLARERRGQRASAREDSEASTVRAPSSEGTARVPAKSIATSPVLTEIMRSSGLAPIPKAPAPPVQEGAAEAEGTRRIRERALPVGSSGEPEPRASQAHSPALTRWMLKAWPWLALVAMAAALVLAWKRNPKPTASPPQPSAPSLVEQPAQRPDVPTETASPSANVVEAPKTPDLGADAGAREQGGRSTLSINALPWADVSIDGKALGTTPLRKIKLRSGVHRVELSCPPLGRSRSLSVELPTKGDARMVIDLQQDPPRTFLDGAKEVR